MTEQRSEIYVSVDVETSGPIPGEFSLLSIGACLAYEPERSFSCELRPISDRADPEAMAVTGMSLERLKNDGMDPAEAMRLFGTWLADVAGSDGQVVFVGFNAPFDWSFVNYYFHRFCASNPFGFTALDIKALYMGKTDCAWSDTRSSRVSARLEPRSRGDHVAVHDAQFQAELFRLVRAMP